MNDFTKEELGEIKRCLRYMINGGVTPYSNLTIDIKQKIQVMINIYCEHDFELEYTPCNCCKKCGVRK